MSDGLLSGLEWSKYINFLSPVAAGYLALMSYEINQLFGIALIAYVVIWIFANATGFLIMIRDNARELSPWTEEASEDPAGDNVPEETDQEADKAGNP